ncbi:formyltetrahydrofolate deformylase [Aromatoleum toluvorans]|uniref:Formyltetrahydrofolate deformylase n=1 Tax=Aromatoleum toluvorans TaxID=92002 RepID=A0ABX1Q326_9RHOO|nr:formyltetrahydrofolate deformylase [Aromatoleum toluvorans]NMG46114.1 formyltetrahydrofolate deformylase [Aromatoleum toluvorans]
MSVMAEGKNTYILKATCKAAIGTVARISTFLAERRCYIMEMAQFDDVLSGRFFVRVVFSTTPGRTPSFDELKRVFGEEIPRAEEDLQWEMHDTLVRPKVLLMVSKFDHCLDDLLYRKRTGELKMDVPAIVSNHPDLRHIAEWHGVPFHHLQVLPETKAYQEARLMEIVTQTGADLVVLARYMQVLSEDLCRKLSGRAINIHHSFLPGFKGAKPYHQAHDRGVKLIGATAHYVTADLDEGPIIEQAVERVDHSYQPEHLVAVGRDTECMALARAVRYHIEHRVFLDGNKTVVFR